MNLDAKVCYCFHVSRRKLVNFCNQEHPVVASQLSQCGGAGTGCGWCIPFIKKIFKQYQDGQTPGDLDQLTSEEYAQKRAEYIRAGGGVPAEGAEPLPDSSPHAPS